MFRQVLARVTWFDPIDVSHPATPCQMFWHRHLPPTGIKVCGKILWVLTTARNVVIVVVCTGISYACNPGVNFTNILRTAFSYESVLGSFSLLTILCFYFFCRKNIGRKASGEMLVKLTAELPKLPEDQRSTVFILTGKIDSGLPSFQPPPFSMNVTSITVVSVLFRYLIATQILK